MAKIIVRYGASETTHELSKEVTTVGRSNQNTVALKDISLSRTHCELRKTGNGWTVVDLGSRNGTTVNGAHVKEKVLEVGDKIEIGNTVIIYEKPIAGRDYSPKDADPSAPKGSASQLSNQSTMVKPSSKRRESERIVVGGLPDVSGWAKEGRGLPRWVVPVAVLVVLGAGGFFAWQSFAGRRAAADVKDLIKENPGFEGKRGADGLPDGWKALPGSKALVAVVQTQFHSGKNSLLIDKSAGGELVSGAEYLRAIPVAEGACYALSAWVHGEEFKGAATARLEWFAKGSDLPLAETYAPWAAAPTEWTEVKCVVSPPPGAARLALSCVAVGLSGKVYFDDFSLEPASGPADMAESRAQLASFTASVSASGSVRLSRESTVLWTLGELSYRAGGDLTRQGYARARRPSVAAHSVRSEGALFDPSEPRESAYEAEWGVRGQDAQARFRCSKGAKAGPLTFAFRLERPDVKKLTVHGAAEQAVDPDGSGAEGDVLTVELSKAVYSLRFIPAAHVRATTSGDVLVVECEFKAGAQDGGQQAMMLIGSGKDVAPLQAAAAGQSVAETLTEAIKAEEGGRLGDAISGYRAILADAKSEGTREAEAARSRLPAIEEKAAAALAEAHRLARLGQLTGAAGDLGRATRALSDVKEAYARSDYGEEAATMLGEVSKEETDDRKASDDARAQALLQLGESAKQDGQATLAEVYLRRVIATWPGSDAAKKAQELLGK